jgi:mRNA-degrading endonuclease RelE of RelBE toxin-antitoxin system
VNYGIQFTADGLQDAKALPKNGKNSLVRELRNKLAKDPAGCSEQLREPLTGWRSSHSGKYRVIFKLYEDLRIIAVAGIGKHSVQPAHDIYRRLELVAKRGRLAESILATLRSFSGAEE